MIWPLTNGNGSPNGSGPDCDKPETGSEQPGGQECEGCDQGYAPPITEDTDCDEQGPSSPALPFQWGGSGPGNDQGQGPSVEDCEDCQEVYDTGLGGQGQGFEPAPCEGGDLVGQGNETPDLIFGHEDEQPCDDGVEGGRFGGQPYEPANAGLEGIGSGFEQGSEIPCDEEPGALGFGDFGPDMGGGFLAQ